jgi:hypothetical protein
VLDAGRLRVRESEIISDIKVERERCEGDTTPVRETSGRRERKRRDVLFSSTVPVVTKR